MTTLREGFIEGYCFDPEATRLQRLAGGVLFLIDEIETRSVIREDQERVPIEEANL